MTRPHPTRPRPARRGSAYVLVLGIALLLTVIGMGTLLTTRLAGKQAANASDWQQAGLMAQSMAEQAISYLNAQVTANPTIWRNAFTSYTTGSPAFSQTTSIGVASWVVKDEVDGNFSNNYADPFRLYCIAKVGQTTRVYSVQVVPAGSPMDVLRCGLHAAGSITTQKNGGFITLGSGPISTNSLINTSANISGNVECLTQTGPTDNVSGTLTTGAPTKPMPSAGLYSIYLAKATALPWSTVSGGIQNQLLNSTNNPYGSLNANGVYSIAVPSGLSFTITSSRIQGTLLISMNGGALNLNGPVLWEPARSDYPILILNGTNVTVNIQGSSTWLSESLVGLDLNGNGTTTDDLPPQYRGLIHIIGSTNTLQVNSNAYISGSVITDGTVITARDQSSFISDPNLYANPPMGYGKGDQLMIVPGSWIWDSPP